MQRIAAVVAATLLSGVDTTEVRSSSPSDGGAKCGYEDHVDTSYVDTSYMQMEFSTNAEVEMPAKKVEEFGIDTKGKGKRAADFIKEGAKAEDVDMKEPDKADDAAKVMPRAMDAMKDYQHTAVLKANDSSPAATPAPPPYDGVVVNGVSAFQVGSDYQICDPDPSSVLSGCHGASSGVTCTYTDCMEDCHADASCNFFYVVFAGPRLGRCKKLTSCPGMRTIVDLSNLYRTFKVQTQGPTPAPTPSTAQVAPTSQVAAAKGDPHLTNMYGQHFDLMQPGFHLFAHIPRWAAPSHTLMKIEAEVQRIGGQCNDMYIQSVNVTGKWAGQRGIRFKVGEAPTASPWHQLNVVKLKVKEGRTKAGVRYLNVLVHNLEKVNYPVGGLLGQDDHKAASTPTSGCRKSMVL